MGGFQDDISEPEKTEGEPIWLGKIAPRQSVCICDIKRVVGWGDNCDVGSSNHIPRTMINAKGWLYMKRGSHLAGRVSEVIKWPHVRVIVWY